MKGVRCQGVKCKGLFFKVSVNQCLLLDGRGWEGGGGNQTYLSVNQFPLLAAEPTICGAAVFVEAKVVNSIPSAACMQ